jgi:Holliday junction resolvase-like predicted endonuclease
MPAEQSDQAELAGEELVAELFRQLGYDVLRNVRVAGIELDLVVQRNELCSPVEIFFPKKLRLDKLHYNAVKLHALQHVRKDLQTLSLSYLARQVQRQSIGWKASSAYRYGILTCCGRKHDRINISTKNL